jgi:parallel beta-helix repeat protein
VAIKRPSCVVGNPEHGFRCRKYARVLPRVPEIDRWPPESRGREEPKLLRTIMVTMIVVVLFAGSLSLLPKPSSEIPPTPIPASISYTTHGVITINGNAQFNNSAFPSNGVVSGNGTFSNPYIIEGWNITALGSPGIRILNTNAYFIIRDCYVHDGGSSTLGIYLVNCVNGVISNNTVSHNSSGVFLQSSSGNVLSNNTFNLNVHMAVYLTQSSNSNTISNNFCNSSGQYGISIQQSSSNTLSNNNCSSNQYGVYLSQSSSNNIVSLNQLFNNSGPGVSIQTGSNNRFWNNSFTGNNGGGVQANDDGTNNLWNTSGTPHGYGNYWSDLTEPDANLDGIVDWSYNLTGIAGAKDYYPLTTTQTQIPEFGMMPLVALVFMAVIVSAGETRQKRKS